MEWGDVSCGVVQFYIWAALFEEDPISVKGYINAISALWNHRGISIWVNCVLFVRQAAGHPCICILIVAQMPACIAFRSHLVPFRSDNREMFWYLPAGTSFPTSHVVNSTLGYFFRSSFSDSSGGGKSVNSTRSTGPPPILALFNFDQLRLIRSRVEFAREMATTAEVCTRRRKMGNVGLCWAGRW